MHGGLGHFFLLTFLSVTVSFFQDLNGCLLNTGCEGRCRLWSCFRLFKEIFFPLNLFTEFLGFVCQGIFGNSIYIFQVFIHNKYFCLASTIPRCEGIPSTTPPVRHLTAFFDRSVSQFCRMVHIFLTTLIHCG